MRVQQSQALLFVLAQRELFISISRVACSFKNVFSLLVVRRTQLIGLHQTLTSD